MARTVEVTVPSEHFALFTPPISVPDGHGGNLTAAVGVRYPTADAYGQLVFFWQDATFLGWDSIAESVTIRLSSPSPDAITAAYAHYGPHAPLCCPRLPPVAVSYRWNGHRLAAHGIPPRLGRPMRVMLQSS